MSSSNDTDREALITLLGGEEYARGGGPVFGNRALHPSQAVAIADVILTEFLPGYTERVKAEQQDADYRAVAAGMPESGPHILGSERRSGIIEGVRRSLDAIRPDRRES